MRSIFYILFLSSVLFSISCARLELDYTLESNNSINKNLLGNKNLEIDYNNSLFRSFILTDNDNEKSASTYNNISITNINFSSFPVDIKHQAVNKWINHFKGPAKNQMRGLLGKSSRYLTYMKKIFEEKNMPSDLAYIPLIESHFKASARSNKGAVGYWQFIPETARRYDLIINNYIDERRDIDLSTRAAADYLSDLYEIFGSWRLALASYNCGEACIGKVHRKYYKQGFWYLYNNSKLNSETKEYVPKIMASIAISKNPSKYGFVRKNIKYEAPLRFYLKKLGVSKTLPTIAKDFKVKYEDIKDLNAQYKNGYVSKGDIVRIPKK